MTQEEFEQKVEHAAGRFDQRVEDAAARFEQRVEDAADRFDRGITSRWKNRSFRVAGQVRVRGGGNRAAYCGNLSIRTGLWSRRRLLFLAGAARTCLRSGAGDCFQAKVKGISLAADTGD